MRGIVKKTAIAISLILAIISCYSQNSGYLFKNFNTENGLGHNDSYSVVEDKNGLIWIGGLAGLQRFDGYEFKNFYNDSDPEKSVHLNRIRSVLYDKSNSLIINSDGGIYSYNLETEQFRNYSFYLDSISKKTKISSNALALLVVNNKILIEEKRKLYFAEINLDSSNYVLHEIKLPIIEKKREAIASRGIVLPNGNLFASVNGVLFQLYDNGKKIEVIKNYEKILLQSAISFTMSTNNVLIVGGFARISFIHFSAEKDLKLKFETLESYSSTTLPIFESAINTIIEDNRGSIWIGSINQFAKIDHITEANQKIESFTSNPNNLRGLPSDWVMNLFIDSSNKMWISTFRGGISLLDLNQLPFKQIVRDPDNPDFSLKDAFVQAIYEDKEGRIWAGTRQGGINIFDYKKNELQVINTSNSAITSNIIRDFNEGPDGNIYISTSAAISRYNTKLRKIDMNITPYGMSTRFWTMSNIFDKYGRLWVIDNLNVLYIFKKSNDNYEVIQVLSNQKDSKFLLSSNNLTYLFYDSIKNEMFVSSENGLNRLVMNDSGDIVDHYVYKYKPNYKYSLSGNYVWPILKENDSTYWVGTLGNGLNKLTILDGRDENGMGNYRSIVYDEANGARSKDIKSLLRDDQGNLWMGANGIMRFDPKTEKFWNFNKNDGLMGNGFVVSSRHKGNSGTLYFGGNGGITYFNPAKINDAIDEKSRICFTGLNINYKDIEPGEKFEGKVILKASMPNTESINIPYGKNTVNVSFSDLCYYNPAKNNFTYLLSGFNNEWVDLGNKNSVSLTGLSPGKYILKVKVLSTDGVTISNTIELKIAIVPPFWMTTWFIIVCIIGILALMVFLYFNHTRNLRKQQQILRKTVDEQTKELKEALLTKDRFFSILAHDLRNPFGSIMNLSHLLYEQYDILDDDTRHEIIKTQFSMSNSLFDLLENLLYWGRIQINKSGFMKIENLKVHPIIEQLVISNKLNTKHISIENQVDPDHCINADANMASFIARNIIQNAIKFSYENDKIVIQSRDDGDFISLIIIDHGKGMSTEIKQKLLTQGEPIIQEGTQGEMGTGLGLSTSIFFLKKMEGYISIVSAPNRGATFIISFPKGKPILN